MEFKVKNDLMMLVSYDVNTYKRVAEFVDSKEKLEIFGQQWQMCTPENRDLEAIIKKSEEVWEVVK